MNAGEQRLQICGLGSFPSVSHPPVKNEALIGLHEVDCRTARRITNDLVTFDQRIYTLPAQGLVEHTADKRRRRVDRAILVLDEQLINVADQFDWKVTE